MTFNNPLVGSEGTLVRDWIQSENFVTNVSGWRISQNGDAEFNAVTLRSNLFVQGNDGSYVRISTTGTHADILLRPTNDGTSTWNAARITADLSDFFGGGVGNLSPTLTITAPWSADAALINASSSMLFLGPSSFADDRAIISETSNFLVHLTGSGTNLAFAVSATTGAGTTYPFGGTADFVGCTLTASSHVYDITTINPVAHVPTNTAVGGLQVEGFNGTFFGYACASSTVPQEGVVANGVHEVTVSGVSNTGITVWILRGNATATNVYYQVIGQ